MSEQIKEGDYVQVPHAAGQPIFGQVKYINGLLAEVTLINRRGGRTGKRGQYRVSDLKKTGMKTEAEIRRENNGAD